jgi:NADPH2:quinone reductase
MRAVLVGEHGGPEVLRLADTPRPEPGPGQILVRVAYAGVNFIDVYQRSGLYPTEVPFTPGVEGAGVVEVVGEGVVSPGPGAPVAWTSSIGSYAEYNVLPADKAVEIPAGIDLDVAAAAALQGMTAHYLVTDTYPLSAEDVCLVHAGAGGVGHLLIQMAKMRGATVFATAGGADKVRMAQAMGADHVIDYGERDFKDAVEEIAGKHPLSVVYDGVGRATFDRGLDLLRRRGTMVTFGNASGPPDAVDPLRLMRAGSVYLTRPTLFDYVAERADLERRAAELFGWIAVGALKVHIGARLPLTEASQAHRNLEARATTGKVILEI